MGFNDYDIKMGDFSRYKLGSALYDAFNEYYKAKDEAKFYKLVDEINDATIAVGYGYYEIFPNMVVKWKDTHIRHRKRNITVAVLEEDDRTTIYVSERALKGRYSESHRCSSLEEASDYLESYKETYDDAIINCSVDLYEDEPFVIEDLQNLIASIVKKERR